MLCLLLGGSFQGMVVGKMRLDLLDICAFWTAAREKSFAECVDALHRTVTLIDRMQQSSGQWRVMREGPYDLGRPLSMDRKEMQALVTGELDPTTVTDNCELFGYGFHIEYTGEIPLALEGRVCKTIEDIRFKNSVALSFMTGNEIPEYSLSAGQIEQLFRIIVETWDPQTTVTLSIEYLDAVPFASATFPRLGWLNYFGEPEVVRLLGDLGQEYAGGVLIKATQDFSDLTIDAITGLARQLQYRGLDNIVWREL